jgi:hypothetical protein
MKRLQDIARVHGITEERFRELLDSPLTAVDGYSSLNPVEAAEKAFSTDVKKKRSSRVAMAMFALLLFLPMGISTSLAQTNLQGSLRWLIYIGGVFATAMAYLLAKNFVTSRGFRRPAQALRNKLEQQGFGDAARKGVLVGLAPAARTRKYENHLFWDAGLLWLTADKLYYLGEETQFALERERIARVYWRNARPEWLSDRSLFIEWNDAENAGVTNILYFLRIGESSIVKERHELVSLHDRLNEWLKRSENFPEASLKLKSLPAPSFAEITSELLNDAFSLKLVIKAILLVSFVSAVLSFTFRLSFAGACYSIFVLSTIVLLDELPKILKRGFPPKPRGIAPASTDSHYAKGVWAESNPAASVPGLE